MKTANFFFRPCPACAPDAVRRGGGVAISLLLILVALLATYIPARRAARLDPMTALARN